MPPSSENPVRRSIPRTLSLDEDATLLLKAMCPSSKAYGLLCSELIRREAERRVRRAALIAQLRQSADADV